jgi:hypothetical protein
MRNGLTLSLTLSLSFSLSLVLAACAADDGGDGDGTTTDPWDAAVDDFVQAGCVEAATCSGEQPAECEGDVRADLDDARAELDAAGESRCIQCMTVKVRELRKIIAASCDISAADQAAVFAACDLDPATDYDGDGQPANDDDEACAGFP